MSLRNLLKMENYYWMKKKRRNVILTNLIISK